MATIKILRDCVVAHKRRIPGELLDVDEYTARRLADESPGTFEWVDRPVEQFVDVKPEAPVGEDKARTPARKSAQSRKKTDAAAIDAEAVPEAKESEDTKKTSSRTSTRRTSTRRTSSRSKKTKEDDAEVSDAADESAK
ncbi:MAG: hypothetical protein JXR84_13155 [Anaerolineae bacterium]|nr:hypothetical protein [Anaerolineae bacterium]